MAAKPPKEQPPVLHSAIPGQGMYSIGDASGNRRWIGAGREVNGWKVGDYDHKTNTLSVSKGDRKEYLQMGAGSVSDYTPPVATPNAETLVGGGMRSENENNMMESLGNGVYKSGEGYYMKDEISAVDLGAFVKNSMSQRIQDSLTNEIRNNMIKKVPTATPQEYQ